MAMVYGLGQSEERISLVNTTKTQVHQTGKRK